MRREEDDRNGGRDTRQLSTREEKENMWKVNHDEKTEKNKG